MKTIATLGLALSAAVVSTAALAADLPNRKQAPAQIVAPRTFSWNGVYGGLNGGLLNFNSNGADKAVVGNASGGILGLTAGYNAQMPNNIVLGVEADYGMSNADGTGTGSGKIESLTTIRARAGVAMDKILPYVTGGYAGGNVKATNGGSSNTDFVSGWTAGAGAEYSISSNISAKAEALYVNLGEVDVPTGTKAGYDGGLYRVGINYHF